MASVYDRRMEEIARQREAERAGLHRIEESTETVNRGLSNPLVWLLGIGGIVAVPFTGGWSVAAVIVALLVVTDGGKAYVQAIPPTTADLAAPGAGCGRMAAALGSLAILLLVIALFVLILWANATGQMN